MFADYIQIEEEVFDAISSNRPVVALESTIISHGMPYPQNVETALMLEETVRIHGGIPATIAILDGKICIGLNKAQIEKLANSKAILKASRRDIPVVLATKKSAATTVSATMICARLAGVAFFATGGIGGVHRGAGQSFDISADLEEFARTSILVVSAGAKAILDIRATLEYLETRGVPVLGYRCDEMPAFYYRKSGIPVPYRVDDPAEIAGVFGMNKKLGYSCGILVGNPVPEEFSLDPAEIEACIEKAILEAEKQKISGQKITPFLLQELNEITAGSSLKTNIELVKNNARLCTKIAVEFFKQ